MKRATIFSALCGLLLATAPALAQFPGDVPETFRLRIGGIFATVDSKVIASTAEFPGHEFDLANVLGEPDHRTTFRGEGYWNFAGRSYLDFGYVNFTADTSRVITQDINFGGVTYTAGAEVASHSRSRFISGAYRYEFVKNPSFHLGASLGVTYVTPERSLSASSGVVGPSGPISGSTVTREASLNAPVPLLGLDVEGRIVGSFSIGARVSAIKLTVDPWSGSMVEAIAHADWYFAHNFGVGGGYEYTRINIEKDRGNGSLVKFDYRYDGPRVYFVATF